MAGDRAATIWPDCLDGLRQRAPRSWRSIFPATARSGGTLPAYAAAVEAIEAAVAHFGAFDAADRPFLWRRGLMVSAAGCCLVCAPVTRRETGADRRAERDGLAVSPISAGCSAFALQRKRHWRTRSIASPAGDLRISTPARHAGGIGRPVLVIHAEDDKEVSSLHARRYGAAGTGRSSSTGRTASATAASSAPQPVLAAISDVSRRRSGRG